MLAQEAQMAELLSATAMAQRIGRMPLRLRAAVWETALPVAGPQQLRLLGPMAVADLQRAGDERAGRIAAGLAQAWPRIDPAQRKAWLKAPDTAMPLRRAFDALAGQVEVETATVEGLLAVVVDAPSPGLIALLPRAMEAPADAPLAEAAERAALALAARWRVLPRACQEALDEAIAALPRHDAALLRARPLLAALLAPSDLAPRTRAWLSSEDEAGHMALRRAVRKLEGLAGRRWALRLLTEPRVRRAAAEVVAAPLQQPSLQQLAPLLGDWPLLLRPCVRETLAAVSGRLWKHWLGGAVAQALQEQGGAAANACRWLYLLGPQRRCLAMATQALAAPDASVRSLAARWLAEAARQPTCRDAACAALLDFCYDSDESVAGAAARALLALAPAAFSGAAARLARSPHPSLRVLARSACTSSPAVTPEGPQPLWARAAAAKRALEADREATLSQLRSATLVGSIEAVRLAVRLGVVEAVELELLQLLVGGRQRQRRSEAERTRLVATAASALGFLRTQASAAALQQLLGHPDARVRANALEALARRGAAEQTLRRGLDDAAPRTRANACAALLERQPAAHGARETLRSMLAPQAPVEERRSALWAVERALLDDFAQEVASVAQGGAGDAGLRRRARRCARRLLAAMASPSVSDARTQRLGEDAP